jgi:gluconolactonase
MHALDLSPMSDYVILDERFSRLIIGHAKLERLWTGCRWAEGPVYVPAARHLLWSDIPNDRVLRLVEDDGHVSVFASPCGHHNGHTLDGEGRVIACEHGGRRISRLGADGLWRALATHYQGKRLNSPNDVVVKSDGSLWFSDPTYGIDGYYEGAFAASEIGAANVYRLDPASGAVEAVVTDLVRPNGLAFSPDERKLYVADTGETHVAGTPRAIHAYHVGADGKSLGREGVFAVSEAGLFDGFRVDTAGNIWTSSADSVRVFAPEGTMIGRIPVPELVSNLCFGGRHRNRLYITAQTSLYAIYVNAHPAGWRPE